jgi:hypothetical protein
MNKKLSTQDYMEILKKKRQDGTYDYADRVFYKGKVMLKCPPGSTKAGNTCVPSMKTPAGMGPGKTWQKDLGGINPQQVQQLATAKSQKDVKKARKSGS